MGPPAAIRSAARLDSARRFDYMGRRNRSGRGGREPRERFRVLDVNLGGALLAGLISFVSPCVLPIVPPYLCFLAGLSIEELQHGRAAGVAGNVFGAALAFVLGFTSVFVAMGATASVIG